MVRTRVTHSNMLPVYPWSLQQQQEILIMEKCSNFSNDNGDHVSSEEISVDEMLDDSTKVTSFETDFSMIDRLACLRKGTTTFMKSRLVRIARKTREDKWMIDLNATPLADSGVYVLSIASTKVDPFDPLFEGDTIRSINGILIGSSGLDTLKKVLHMMSEEIDVLVEVVRGDI